jgi:hypothetical protein
MGFKYLVGFPVRRGIEAVYFDESLWCQNVLTKVFTSIGKEGIFVLTLMAIDTQSVLGQIDLVIYDVD